MAKRTNVNLNEVVAELRIVRSYLERFIKILPEESLDDYRNSVGIKKAYLRSFQTSND